MDEGRAGPRPRCRIGIDIAGGRGAGILLDARGQICARAWRPLAPGWGWPQALQCVVELQRTLAAPLAGAGHALGVALPDAMLGAPPWQRELQRCTGRATVLVSHAQCLALAENDRGAAVPYDDVLALLLGAQPGAGLVVARRLLRGRRGRAGQWGHLVLDPGGPRCACGRSGCVACYLGDGALRDQYLQWTGRSLDAAGILARARAGDRVAATLRAAYLVRLAQAADAAVALLDPQAIVLGGELGGVDGLGAAAARLLRQRHGVPVRQARLGAAASSIGAALAAA